ncbi:MAG: hypothetical protein NTW21_23135 [Verrucomicrobia bacterium]|nr:hypothetical protein [Verrucomicrobiota bacterium]
MGSAGAWLAGVCWLAWLAIAPCGLAAEAVIVVAPEATPLVRLAAREVHRYVYLRSGERLPVRATVAPGQDAIRLLIDQGLGPQAYRMKTVGGAASGRILDLTGGSEVAVLYAAYHFAETLGVRFYLHGDVVPDERIRFVLPDLDETHAPLFETRGILPFHDFTEGPDWWEVDDYKAHFTQLVKLRMNLMALHCYPEGGVGPEPLVWIGHPDDVDAAGKVACSPPALWASTMGGAWGYAAVPTSNFAAGAGRLFAEDDYGPSVTRGHRPRPQSPEGCNEVFERAAGMFREAFGYGRHLGVKICIGTEAPLNIPQSVQARLREKGLDPNQTEVRQVVYEGMFTRIARAYPIDHYWLWTPEAWTWRGATQAEVEASTRDINTAMAALKKVGNPFGFGTCGWELGPKHDRGLFDNLLPKDAVMSCINRNIGFNWVDPEFVRIKGRPTWAIPWLEDDSAMVLPQLWAGRMRRDAADALAYGCSGLLGIHWRTKVLAPNVSALARAAWSQDGWNPEVGKPAAKPVSGGELAPLPKRKRDLPCADFYADLSAAWFGPEVAAEMAGFLARFDGDNGAYEVSQGRATLPRPNTWLYGPGAIVANREPWAQASTRYAFVAELAALRDRVKGAGARDRFDYWLNTFRYVRALDEVACTRGALDLAMEQVKAEHDAARRKELARSGALPVRVRLARTWETMMTYLLAVTDTPGELGTIANLEQSTRGALKLVEGYDEALAGALGEPLPGNAQVSSRYQGAARIIVPTARTVVAKGETPTLKVMVLDNELPTEVELRWRTLGEGEFKAISLRHVARGVFAVTLPLTPEAGAEYYVRAKTVEGQQLVWPATAPAMNHTLVQLP